MTVGHKPEFPRRFLKICALLVCVHISTSNAQESSPLQTDATKVQVNQLNDLVESLTAKTSARDTIRETVASADPDDLAELKANLDELNADIKETRFAIEQIAVGTAVLEESQEDSVGFNWRTELNEVLMPVVQNLKRITEKPRKIELLRTRITSSTEQLQNAEIASSNITSTLQQATEPATNDVLTQLQQSWVQQAEDHKRDINLATIQLTNLQRNDTPLWMSLRDAFMSFLTGRGLTLLLAAVAAVLVYFGAKALAKIFSTKQKGEKVTDFRTRQRIVHYGLKAVKTILILIVVIMVFYIRGDILLLTIAFMIAGGIALSLRHTVPQFLDELKLLLNIGPIREDERVMYLGLPWKVTALNMHSILKNPEITGIHRVPIKEMASLKSRPSGNEPWFPASKHDYILLEDKRLMLVKKLTPEHIILESRGGTETMIPTTDFYNMVFENLSRSSSYLVTSVFGIGYSHQAVSVTDIPAILKKALEKQLSISEFSESVISVRVELQEAGSSSLDFWLSVKMKSESARYHPHIQRVIQQVCVAICTREKWDIPFPQLTLHNSSIT